MNNKPFYQIYMLFNVLVITLFMQPAHAIELVESDFIKVLSVQSTGDPQPIAFNITLPPSYYTKPNKRYAVIFDFHPRSQPYLSGLHDWMSHNGDWPWLETIVVTPRGYSDVLGKLKTIGSGDELQTTGAKLLDFVEKGLLKQLDESYRTNSFRIFNGFTGNASLGLYTLLNRPELFNAYIIASPILSDNYGNILRDAAKQLSLLNDKTRTLFLSTSDSNYEKGQLTEFSQLTEIISKGNFPQLDATIKRFDGSYYMSQPALAAVYGIEAIFNDYHRALKPDSVVSLRGTNAIIKHYQYLTEHKYGFEVSAESSLKALAFDKLVSEPAQAIKILKITVEQYPESAYAHQGLAKAYFELQQFEQAVARQKIAVEKSKTMIPWHQKKHKSILKQYLSAIKDAA
jgi:tetratricopeptide (TPR) repeat protein